MIPKIMVRVSIGSPRHARAAEGGRVTALCFGPPTGPAGGEAIGHAGEILQGAIRDGSGVRRVLVSLPTLGLWSRAEFRPVAGGGLRVLPEWKQKSLRAARLTLDALDGGKTSGILEISSNIPICRGFGSSTSDCVAAIRAVAAALRVSVSPEVIAEIAQAAESSIDGTMFGGQLVAIFHCEGVVCEYFPGPPPDLYALAVDTAPAGDGIPTDSLHRPEYTSEQIELFEILLQRLRRAVAERDLHEIGAVASASAGMNEAFAPKPHFARVMRVAEETSALGVAAAHSGTVLALLYAPGTAAETCIAMARRLLAESGLPESLLLRTPRPASPAE